MFTGKHSGSPVKFVVLYCLCFIFLYAENSKNRKLNSLPYLSSTWTISILLPVDVSKNYWMNGKQSRPRTRRLIGVYIVCSGVSVRILSLNTVSLLYLTDHALSTVTHFKGRGYAWVENLPSVKGDNFCGFLIAFLHLMLILKRHLF